ncbi:MAG TPA: glycosyltransferase [Blastocatellia bacterium]|nr:glycosyltransferase [Blastocatellia bacterium]
MEFGIGFEDESPAKLTLDKLTILITNNTLAGRAGSELYVRDLATGLLERGHKPIAFSTILGDVAAELRSATIPVIDNLDSLAGAPDIIHGQHHLETMMALLRFPDTPAIYFCHGWLPWEETPPRFQRILKYVAVDDTCRDRLVFENAIPESKLRVLLNFVDLERFRPRGPLPAQPKRALVFSNYADEHTHLSAVREACERCGVPVDVIGRDSGKPCSEPEKRLGEYDIVFAKARSALEAMAVGSAVILCDASGVGGMVTAGELARLRRLNFGIRALRQPVSAVAIAREIARYDPRDAALVSARIRAVAGREAAIDEILGLYQEAISEFERTERDPSNEQRAASDYLRWLSPALKDQGGIREERDRILVELDRLKSRSDELEQKARESRLAQQAAENEQKAAEARLTHITRTLGWRLLSRYGQIKHRLLIPVYRQLRKPRSGDKI